MKASILRAWLAVILFSAVFVCFVHAKPKKPKLSQAEINKFRAICGGVGKTYRDNCVKNIPPPARQEDVDQCNKDAEAEDIKCLRDSGVLDARAGASGIGEVSPPPKSNTGNPTATPRRGPGKAGPSGIGHSSSTATPSESTRHGHSGKPSPTP